MDKETRHYRKGQIKKVLDADNVWDFPPTIQIRNNGTRTNHMNITFEELEKIKSILTREDDK